MKPEYKVEFHFGKIVKSNYYKNFTEMVSGTWNVEESTVNFTGGDVYALDGEEYVFLFPIVTD